MEFLKFSFTSMSMFLLFSLESFASKISSDLLKVQAAFMPKVILMEYNYKEKMSSNKITFLILYDEQNYVDALKLKRLIDTKYNQKLLSYELDVKLESYDSYNQTPSKSSVVYCLPTNRDSMTESLSYARENEILSLVYDEKDLKNGAVLSIRVDKYVKPIVSIKALKKSNIEFRPKLLKISEVFKIDEY